MVSGSERNIEKWNGGEEVVERVQTRHGKQISRNVPLDFRQFCDDASARLPIVSTKGANGCVNWVAMSLHQEALD